MDTVLWATFLSLVLFAIYHPQLGEALHVYFRFHRRHPLRCPETGRLASVKIDAARAARYALRGICALEIADCTRWPGRLGCNQACLKVLLLSNGTAGSANGLLTRN
ncbi:MAG: hypothetical protein O2807_11020 [bacterium]|nr:hypothetical protein [bacterium]